MNTTALAERVQGIPALPPLYTNDLMVGILIVCGLILAVVMADRKGFLPRLLKGFFLPRENAVENIRTTNVIYMRMGMHIVTFASAGTLLTAYASGNIPDTTHNSLLWLLATAAALSFHLLRSILFILTNRIFLSHPAQAVWEHSYTNWAILSGVPLYLTALATIFFDFAPSTTLLLLGTTVAVLEICLAYKAFHIFSGKKYGILQLFVYLCTLELIPLLLVGKALVLFV